MISNFKHNALVAIGVTLFFGLLLMVGCGKKGDLYLPEEGEAVESSSGSSIQQDKDAKRKKPEKSPVE